MDILLVGGKSSLLEAMITKLHKEGHRIFVLMERRFKNASRNRKVFESYYFSYESNCITDVLESVNPDVIICMGAYDTGFDWSDEKKTLVRFSAGMSNLLMAYSLREGCRFLFLSSEEVYSDSYPEDVREEEPVTARGVRPMQLASIEQLCLNYHRQMQLDTVVLRLDHLYDIPADKRAAQAHLCGRVCTDALRNGRIFANEKNHFSLLYFTDAADLIYKVAVCKEHKQSIYHISSSEEMDEAELAKLIWEGVGGQGETIGVSVGTLFRLVLSNRAYDEEFGIEIACKPKEYVCRMAEYMERHKRVFTSAGEERESPLDRLAKGAASFVRAMIPFVENVLCFIPFFMLNNRAVGSEYFAKMDFLLVYVLLFAIIYGQGQATVSALLAAAGYFFRQMYDRTGLEIIMDGSTYVWIAQLFILGLVVGNLRNRLDVLKAENAQEKEYLTEQIHDLHEINDSNAKMKNLLISQLTNQSDSMGKIYQIVSGLDSYSEEEVLFYAAEVVAQLMESRDVAIYSATGDAYARLYSATSQTARQLGNSISYMDMGSLSQAVAADRVYINRELEEAYPLMADAIYSEERVQLIIMVWGIPWERMTLTQANKLRIIGYLIQNTLLKANRYLASMENRRYIRGTNVMEEDTFREMLSACSTAKQRGLVEYTVVCFDTGKNSLEDIVDSLKGMVGRSDYLGELGGMLAVLLFNRDDAEAGAVLTHFTDNGLNWVLPNDL